MYISSYLVFIFPSAICVTILSCHSLNLEDSFWYGSQVVHDTNVLTTARERTILLYYRVSHNFEEPL
jgi:hypothetical protein